MLQWQEHFLFLICHSHLSSACWRVTTGFVSLTQWSVSPSRFLIPPFLPLSSHGMSGQDVIVKSYNNLVETSQTWEQAEQPCCFAHLLMTLQCDKTTHVCFTEGQEVHEDKVRREGRNNNNLDRGCKIVVLSLHLKFKCKFTLGERGKGSRKPKNTSNFLPWLTDELSRQQKPLELLDHLPSSLSIFSTVPFIHVPHLNLFSITTTQTQT